MRKLTHKEYLTLRNTARILRTVGKLEGDQLKRLESYEAACAEYEQELDKQEYFCPACKHASFVVHETHAPVFDVLYAIENDHVNSSPFCRQLIADIRVRNRNLCSDEEWARITGQGANG